MVFGLFSKRNNKEKTLENGRKLAAKGRAAEAMTYFEEALEMDPDYAEAKEAMKACRQYIVRLNLKEAEELCLIDNQKASEHVNLALDLAGDDKELFKEASEVLTKVAKHTPKASPKPAPEKPKRLVEPSCGCASPSCGSDCHEDVGSQFEENPEDLFYFYLDTSADDEKEAFENLGPSFKRAFVALQQGDTAEAAKMLVKAKDEEGKIAAIPYAQALLAWQRNDLKRAEKEFADALNLDPGFASALKKRATVLREMGKPADAAALLEPRLASNPGDKEAVAICAAALGESGNAARAVELLRPVALEDMKKDPQLAILWGRLLEADKKNAEALTAYKTAAAAQPTNAEILEILGIFQIRTGGKEIEGAIKSFKQCYKLLPAKGWYFLLRIAEAQAVGGNKAEAARLIEEARHELPDDPQAVKIWEHFDNGLKEMG